MLTRSIFCLPTKRNANGECPTQHINSPLIIWPSLTLQHKVLQRTFDGQLIVAPVVLGAGDRVLDSGTGSGKNMIGRVQSGSLTTPRAPPGAWIVDLLGSGAVPNSVYLQGLDIEARLLPLGDPQVVSNWNIRFCVGSVLALPPSWTSSFTLIHQRLLVAALREAEWARAFEEMRRALVPGGWVQLCELGEFYGTDAAGPASAKQLALLRALHDARGLMLDCAKNIPTMLEAAGFVDIRVDVRKIELGKWAGPDGVEARDNVLGVFRGIKTPVMKAGGLGIVTNEQELDDMLVEVEKEWDNTPGVHQTFYMICAQKPVEEAEK